MNDRDYILMWIQGFIFLIILVGIIVYFFGNEIITTSIEASKPVSQVISEEK